MKRIVACLLLAFSFAAFAGDAPPAGDKPADAKAAKKGKAKKGDKTPEKKDDKAAEGAKTE